MHSQKKDIQENLSKKKAISGNDLAIGGQAVIEGVMMRSKQKYCVSCRSKDGKIKRQVKTIPRSKLDSLKKIPFIRGNVSLYQSIKLGFSALDFSADVAIDEDDAKNTSTKKEGTKSSTSPKSSSSPSSLKSKESIDILFTSLIFIASLLLALSLFKFLPFYLAGFLKSIPIPFVIAEGLLKLGIFIGYLYVISLTPDIKRVFQYHGAEHKAVHCYEKYGNTAKLTVDNALTFPRIHKRCGTTFMFLVVIISILVYALVPISMSFVYAFILRILFLPVIAGISFEILVGFPKLSKNNPFYYVFLILEYPGLLLQYITTKEPDRLQQEVALDSLKHVLGTSLRHK